MDLVSENTRILYTPRTNISMDGQVPKELSGKKLSTVVVKGTIS